MCGVQLKLTGQFRLVLKCMVLYKSKKKFQIKWNSNNLEVSVYNSNLKGENCETLVWNKSQIMRNMREKQSLSMPGKLFRKNCQRIAMLN